MTLGYGKHFGETKVLRDLMTTPDEHRWRLTALEREPERHRFLDHLTDAPRIAPRAPVLLPWLSRPAVFCPPLRMPGLPRPEAGRRVGGAARGQPRRRSDPYARQHVGDIARAGGGAVA